MSNSMALIDLNLAEHASVLAKLTPLKSKILEIALIIKNVIDSGGIVYWCGNGGSAADSQHLAAELMGRFKKERGAIPSIALTTDSSALTCIGNDYSFDEVFSRQVEGVVRERDVLIALSTSGNSPNVCKGVAAAKVKGATTIALSGKDGGELCGLVDFSLVIPSDSTARIQEMHITIGHIICDYIDADLVD